MQSGRQVFGGGVLAELHTLASVVNTVVSTDLFTFSLPAGRLQAGDVLLLSAAGDNFNNTAGAVNYTLKLRLGATYMLNAGAIGIGNNANRKRWTLSAEILIVSATSQLVTARYFVSNPSTGNWVAIATSPSVVGNGSASEDTTTVKTLGFEVTLGTADPNVDMRVAQASLILVREAP